jgi:hypothetical protein
MSRRILFEKRIRSIARTPAHRPSELPKPCPQATAVHAFGGLRKIAPVGMITNDDFVRIVLACRSRQATRSRQNAMRLKCWTAPEAERDRQAQFRHCNRPGHLSSTVRGIVFAQGVSIPLQPKLLVSPSLQVLRRPNWQGGCIRGSHCVRWNRDRSRHECQCPSY